MRGRFITLEGGEGAGKSTLAMRLKAELGLSVAGGRQPEIHTTREPGGSHSAERIRDVLLDRECDFDPMEELLLLTAARRNHVRTLIEPALDQGDWVICDRFHLSTLAYQGAAGGVSAEEISEMHERFVELEPDLTIVLDLEPAVGLRRSTGPRDRFDDKDLDYHERLREGFLTLARGQMDRCVVIDAGQGADDVFQRARAIIENRFKHAF